jgi:hypothetical protein
MGLGRALALLVLLAVGARALRLLVLSRMSLGAGGLVMLLRRLLVLALAGTLVITHYDTPCVNLG